MNDRVIVITGASAGIGACLVELIGRRGGHPVLVARRETELRQVAARCGDTALPVVGDVTKRDDMKRAVSQAIARFGRIDAWVSNAGRGISKLTSELTDEDVDEMMLTNVKSMLYGVQAVLPHFKERGRGHLITVSSLLGRVPLAPIRSVYCASKHAVNALTATLRLELRASHPGIHVSTVHPGIVATDFGKNALHGGFDSRALSGAQPPSEVAEVIADVIARPRADVYTRDGAKEMVVAYYAADDMGEAETKPPFMNLPPPTPK